MEKYWKSRPKKIEDRLKARHLVPILRAFASPRDGSARRYRQRFMGPINETPRKDGSGFNLEWPVILWILSFIVWSKWRFSWFSEAYTYASYYETPIWLAISYTFRSRSGSFVIPRIKRMLTKSQKYLVVHEYLKWKCLLAYFGFLMPVHLK